MPAVANAPMIAHRVVAIRTQRPVEFVDITPVVADAVRETGLAAGLAMIQTRHTTTGLLINENEPLLRTTTFAVGR